jgi:hypothetical protein
MRLGKGGFTKGVSTTQALAFDSADDVECDACGERGDIVTHLAAGIRA